MGPINAGVIDHVPSETFAEIFERESISTDLLSINHVHVPPEICNGVSYTDEVLSSEGEFV